MWVAMGFILLAAVMWVILLSVGEDLKDGVVKLFVAVNIAAIFSISYLIFG
jgi:hypothetical protein